MRPTAEPARANRYPSRSIWGVLLLVAVVLVAAIILLPKSRLYYPAVTLQASETLQIGFIQQGLSSETQCTALTRAIAQAITGFCPDCVVTASQCLTQLTPRQRLVLNGRAVDVPVMRLPNGALTFEAAQPELAQQVCRDSAREAAGMARCTPPDPIRLATMLAESSATQWTFVPTFRTLAGLTLLTALASFLICGLIIWSERWHFHYTHDLVGSGPQKFHAVAVPRIGGLAIACALATAILGLLHAGLLSTATAEGFALLALAAVPAFAGGLAEDLTKKVGVLARLLLTMAAGVLASLLIGATLGHLDVPGLDNLLQHWPLFAIAFTAFAVGGVANAINIIDGYNGLVGGYSIIVLAAVAWVSAQVGDPVVLIASLSMLGAMAGFLVWNWPYGKIFLGDGGAYLLGFWLAELGVLLVVRNPEVSPWFPLAIMAYPIWETLFSIYRKSLLRGHSSGRPDGLHAHMLIYKRLIPLGNSLCNPETKTQRNNAVAVYIWTFTIMFSVLAVLFWNKTPLLLLCAFAFSALYSRLYMQIIKFRTPPWLIRRTMRAGNLPHTQS